MSDEVKAVAPVMTAQAIEGEAGKPRVSDIVSDAKDRDAKDRGDIAAEMKDAADDARPEDSESDSWETDSEPDVSDEALAKKVDDLVKGQGDAAAHNGGGAWQVLTGKSSAKARKVLQDEGAEYAQMNGFDVGLPPGSLAFEAQAAMALANQGN
jgi:hypothetical protein